MVFDPFTIIMLVVLAVLIFFMFRNSRKRQQEMHDARELQAKVVAGAKVMTNFGVFGTILSIDEEENQVELESTPGTVLTVHRQTIARVVDAAEEAPATSTAAVAGEPEFGQRVDDTPGDETPDVKKTD